MQDGEKGFMLNVCNNLQSIEQKAIFSNYLKQEERDKIKYSLSSISTVTLAYSFIFDSVLL